MNRLYVALLASAALSSFAVAQNRGNEHFGGLTLDVPLAVTSGGLGNATGNASTLTVLPSGATTIQTLAKALSRISDVRFYGTGGAAVDQTCTTDTSSAIMSAANSGGQAFLPAGCYLVSSPIILNAGAYIRGAGRDLTTIKLAPGANTDVIQTAGVYGLFGNSSATGVNDWEISDLTIDGNATAQTATGSAIDAVNGLAIYGASWRLQHVTIKNILGHGIRSQWQQYGEIVGGLEAHLDDVTIDTAGRHGWWFGGPHDTVTSGLVIIDACHSADSTYSAVFQDTALWGNGRFTDYHSWHRGATTNRCAWGYSSSGSSQFVNAHFEGSRGWFQHNGSSDIINSSLFYAATGATNSAMIVFNGSNNTHSGNIYTAANATNPNIYAMQFGTVSTTALGNLVIGGNFQAFTPLTPFNFYNDGGYNVINSIGYGSTGGATAYGGTQNANTIVTYFQGGTAIGVSNSFSVQAPTGTVLGGNTRGVGAADLQLSRIAANQVASGQYSFVAGANNSASGYSSIGIGYNNNATGYGSIGIGTFINSYGSYSVGLGVNTTDRLRSGAQCHGSGAGALSNGQAQSCLTELAGVATGATAVRLTIANAGASSSTCSNMSGQMAYGLAITLLAFDTTTPTKSWSATWGGGSGAPHILSQGATASTTLVDGVTTAINPDATRSNGTLTGIGATIAADTTNACINLQFTPPTGNTDTWHITAKVETTEAQ